MCEEKSLQFVPKAVIDQSHCRSMLSNYNSDTMSGVSTTKEKLNNISVSGCGNFSMAENDLEIMFDAIDTSNLPDTAKTDTKKMLCLYAFGDCGDLVKLKKKTKQNDCDCSAFSEFQSQTNFKPLLGNLLSCLRAPNFALPFNIPSYINKSNETVCSKDFLPTTSPCLQTCGMYCSPLCNQPGSSKGANIFYIVFYITIALYWICIGVLFITWLKLRKL